MGKQSALDPKTEEELHRKIQAGSQDPEDYRRFADVLISQGRYDEAISLYQRALDLNLTNFQKARLSMELGWIFYDMGSREQSQLLAVDALSLLSAEPESAEVLACRGALQSLLAYYAWLRDEKFGRDAAHLALEWLEKAIVEGTDFEGRSMAYVDAAGLNNLLGNSKQAVKLCRECLQRDLKGTERLSCLLVYGEALRREERFKEAEEITNEAFRYVNKEKGRLPRLYFNLGLIQRFTNRLTEATESFQKALLELQADPYGSNDPRFLGDIYGNLGTAYYDSEKYSEATAAFEGAIVHYSKHEPEYFNALLWLGHCHKVRENREKARHSLREVVDSPHAAAADRDSARIGLAELEYASGEYEKAIGGFQEILRQQVGEGSDRCTALLWLGYCYKTTGSHSEAESCLDKVIAAPHASDEDKALARRGLGELYYESGKYEKAIATFKEVLAYYVIDDPRRLNVLLWQGRSCLATGALDEARNCFEGILTSRLASEADTISAQEGLAEGYYNSGNYKEAAAAFEKALIHQPNEDPNRWNTLVWLGNCYEATGFHEKARDCFEKVLASLHASETDKVLGRRGLARNFGKSCYESRKYDEAVAAFEEALIYYAQNDPDRANAVLWLGHSYFESGAHEKAEDCYEQVVSSPHASEADKASARVGLSRLPQHPKKILH